MPNGNADILSSLDSGDFDRYDLAVGGYVSSLKLYIQGGISDYFMGGPVAPIDLSEVVVSN